MGREISLGLAHAGYGIRAHAEWDRVSAPERLASRPLIPPADVVAVVLELLRTGTGGTVVEMWGGDQPIVHSPPMPAPAEEAEEAAHPRMSERPLF